MLNEVNRLCGSKPANKKMTFDSVLKDIKSKTNLTDCKIRSEFGWTTQHFNIMKDKDIIPESKIHELCVKYKIELSS